MRATCGNCGHDNNLREAGSYFSDCARDESGHCLPGGSAKQPGAPGGGSRLKQGLKIGAGIAAGAGVAAAGYKFGKRAVAQQRWKGAIRGLRDEPGGSLRSRMGGSNPPGSKKFGLPKSGGGMGGYGKRPGMVGASLFARPQVLRSDYLVQTMKKQGPGSHGYGDRRAVRMRRSAAAQASKARRTP